MKLSESWGITDEELEVRKAQARIAFEKKQRFNYWKNYGDRYYADLNSNPKPSPILYSKEIKKLKEEIYLLKGQLSYVNNKLSTIYIYKGKDKKSSYI